ncbi:MAG: nucleotide exchange factor GrpE [Gammaproteobacteria bacterium]|jgi:molecular chaperone GrpE
MVSDDNAVSNQNQKKAAQASSDADGTEKEAGATADSGGEHALSEVTDDLEQLKEKLQKAEEKAANHWDELLRAKAELENTRRRVERDVANAHKFGLEKFVTDLLPVIDSLEMGISAAKESSADTEKLLEGSELTLKMLSDCVQKYGVEAVNPVGEPFNPEFHQAMSAQESNEHGPDIVTHVMQKGYTLNGRLVRPAMVMVSKGPGKGDQGTKGGAAGETKTDEKTQSGKEGENS